MTAHYDVVIVGAGPAGLDAARTAARRGARVAVIDDNPRPGGQVWRQGPAHAPGALLGDAPAALESHANVSLLPSTRVVAPLPERGLLLESGMEGGITLHYDQLILATGARERFLPFAGWTLPGVMTVGAAQILLKTSRQVPSEPVWVAGSGPLPLLYMAQLLRAGGKVAGWLDTSPAGAWRRALPYLSDILSRWGEVSKGLGWLRELRRAGVRRIRGVRSLRALGEGRLETLEYTQYDGRGAREPAQVLLAHEGLVPSVHMTRALECDHAWNEAQACWAPVLDAWGQASRQGIYVAGDGAGIGGAEAARARGELAALGIALHAGKLQAREAQALSVPIRARLSGYLRLRPMLDALYPPRADVFDPSDDTVVCRCEELTAGDIRQAATLGQPGPNQIKAFTRAGMGPCQGRQCGYTIASILAKAHNRPLAEVGLQRVRPPLKPLTLGELATFNIEDEPR